MKPSVKLVFSVDAIFPPLTGIGRYAYELATRLPRFEQVEELRLLDMFRWRQTVPGLQDQASGQPVPWSSRWQGQVRQALASRHWAVEVYDRVSERRRRQMLRQANGFVYHSPNYFLAAHDGPSVATVHDLSLRRFPQMHPSARRRYFDLAFERSLQRAAMLITDSEAVRQELITDYGVAPERVKAVHLGVDPVFRPRPAAELRPVLDRLGLTQGRYTLAVATLEPRKKLDQLMRAYAQLPAALRATYPLVLTGAPGWLNTSMQALIEQARAQGWLHYLGFVPQADLPSVYAGAHAYAMTSIYEGFGLPMLEAMACGVPVLTSTLSCMPEVAGGAALLANPDDLDELRQQLERLLTDHAWREAAVSRGLARAKELSWDRCVAETVAVYQAIA